MNNESLTKAQQNRRMNKLRSIQGMQDMAFPRVQFLIFFSGEYTPGPPSIIRVFGADSSLVSPLTLVLNLQ